MITKIYNRIKNSLSSPRLLTTFLLLIVLAFLFNFNIDVLRVGADVFHAVTGQGTPGYLPKWLLATTVDVSADLTVVYTGDTITLSWSSNNATSCTSDDFDTGSATSGSAEIHPAVTTIYTITCTGVSEASASITVTVKRKPTFIES